MESPIDPEVLIQLLQEVRSLRDEIADLKNIQPIVEKKICKGVTGKGTVCRNGAAPGSDYCRMHCEKTERTEKPKKVKKATKLKKIQPEHTHALGEEPIGICPLCETHGNVMDATLPDCEFNGDESFEEKLKELLKENVIE